MKKKTTMPDTKSKEYSIMKTLSWTNPGHVYKRIAKHPHKSLKAMLIHMELTTGSHTQFIAYIEHNNFIFMGGAYIIDDELKYYDMASKLWSLDYHQDICVPIQRRIPANVIKKSMYEKGVTDVDAAYNPSNLKLMIEGNIIEKVLKGEELEAVFRFLKLVGILTLIAAVLTLVMVMHANGILNNLIPW